MWLHSLHTSKNSSSLSPFQFYPPAPEITKYPRALTACLPFGRMGIMLLPALWSFFVNGGQKL